MAWNPEGAAIFHIDRERKRREHLHDAISGVYPRAEEVLNNPRFAIQAPTFVHAPGFSEQSIRMDMLKVAQAQRAFKTPEDNYDENSMRLGKVFEALVLTQSDLRGSDWLSGASVLKTSRFDDYFHKTDLLAEWPAEHPEGVPSILGLAVDVTFGKSAAQNKLRGIKREIDDGKLSTIKYFRSRDGKIMESRDNIPRVVVGAGHPVVQQLAALWRDGNASYLRTHPFQRGLIEEIRLQLRLIRNYAQKHGLRAVEQAYGEPLAILDRISEEKQHIPLGQMAEDVVYKEIYNVTRDLFVYNPPPKNLKPRNTWT